MLGLEGFHEQVFRLRLAKGSRRRQPPRRIRMIRQRPMDANTGRSDRNSAKKGLGLAKSDGRRFIARGKLDVDERSEPGVRHILDRE